MSLYPPLATAADYTDLVGAEPAGLDVDRLLGAASDAVRRYCGWHIAPPVTETVIFDGYGGSAVLLPSLYVTDVTDVTENGTMLDPAGVQWSADGYLRRAGTGCWSDRWTRNLRGLSVTFRHGYTDIPEDIVALVCTVAARAASSPAGLVREQVGAVSVSYSQVGAGAAGGTALLGHERQALDAYRLAGRP